MTFNPNAVWLHQKVQDRVRCLPCLNRFPEFVGGDPLGSVIYTDLVESL